MIESYIAGLIEESLEVGLIESADQIYVRNQVMSLIKLEGFPDEVQAHHDTIPNLLEQIIAYAVEKNVIENIFDEKEILSANIMNCFVPRPSAVQAVFDKKFMDSPALATSYFYNLSKNNNYIQMNRIAKNISYKIDTQYGTMDITINLSKPEKDPEQIKRERAMKQTGNYPKCLLCMENEGYEGRTGYPARANHRIIHVPLTNENWYLQYSPYVYYNEHCILLSGEHRLMKIDRGAFERLLSFTAKFPHYFIGSNADLPIVGGSILSHDHYQGGNYEFAMTRAEDAFSFILNAYPEIKASVVKWPMSVIRLRSSNREQLVDAADDLLEIWRGYSDESVDVMAYTDDTPHNTITPISRYRDGIFELDLVLRNNRTTDEHPLGIFHPHGDVHHIKKENIGLIEVMGLAVLPPRLQEELAEIEEFLLGNVNIVKDYHQNWAQQIKDKYASITNREQAETIVKEELGKKFVKCLEDAGVLKTKDAFERFITFFNNQERNR
ncbi:UDPglucose--hexose-1-phosphate uridylyltransferase [Bacillus mesophilus]|uniref:Galactose-1-phosphate uridylyltransferase n=1 Tax=Bacillus mesophilus TaxID=1808955 RepID=A0A6M0QA18_9BACI|nr:UDP-glucose--hexose-1-phosphate uridylyltransferase [Bacillus mesophilus]MBM7662728.1 UDPglucose--hexose-1-phosphate uridylyltransferase [Bacillus mesophilus]NEY73211.1 UDP-glucose--hexose-1-phosphate uridylyltransferase [Bacillus mesophilus]